MTRSRFVLIGVLAAISLTATQGHAVVPSRSPLAEKSFRHANLHIPTRFLAVEPAPAELAADSVFYDARAGRLASLIVSQPLIPGTGVGNTLEWVDPGGRPADESTLKDAVWGAVVGYLEKHERVLRVDAAELAPPRIGIFEHGNFIQVFSQRLLNGIRVRDAGVTAIVSHGNLVLLGLQNWGDASPAAAARIGADQARSVIAQHVQPFVVESFLKGGQLEYVPMVSGDGYDFRLVWTVRARVQGDLGAWEGLVDAVSGELIAFVDTNQYATRRAIGGVYPVSNDQRPPDGLEQAGWPMPLLNVTTGSGPAVTNAAGTIGCVTGNVSTALAGRYVRISDACGAIDETAASGDLDLGSGPQPLDTDCTVPAGHSPGDTKSSRSGFYELTRINESARGWLPDNAWLQTPLLANMNIPSSCNAFWSGSVNFFRSSVDCRNTGEIAAILDHEWGHGMDNNGVNPNISGPGEAIADIHAGMRLGTSCTGRGFFRNQTCGGYGDPCNGTPATGCTGVRDIDFANHRCNRPHTVTWALNGFTSAQCGGSGPASACPVSGGTPCGRETHCEGMVAAEAGWDVYARDLQAAPFNLDPGTALELSTRLAFLGSQAITDWYTCAVGGGCGATSGYMLYLAADDDDGNLANGTPHMTAIDAAFRRHEIHCATSAPVNSGCAGGPTTAPVLAFTPQDQGVTLSWGAVAGAARYYVYRTEGVNGPGFGKVKIGETTGTTFLDTNLQNGRVYYLNVLPVGASTSCFGLMSNSATVVPAPGANAAIRQNVTVTRSGGDNDDFLDNCETADVTFTVENSGTGSLTNVRLVGVTFLTHPASVLQTTLPSDIAATLTDCAAADGAFAFILRGATFSQRAQVLIEVTADQLGGQVRSQVITIGGLETDAQPVASRTYDFETGFSGWTVPSGTFTRQTPGASSTSFHLRSSTLLDNRCDRARSPVIGMKANSTLSLFNRYVTETPIPIPYDRANLGVVDLDTNVRTTIVPTGGRPYDLPPATPNGACVTGGEAGWSGSQNTFALSTWSSGAANPGGLFTNKRVQLEIAYGTDAGIAEEGFRFDEVTVADFDDLMPDVAPNSCVAQAAVPAALAVDTAGNSVMEPNETAMVAPAWLNDGTAAIALTGATSNFTGPTGPVYANPDSSASYGTIPVSGQSSCTSISDCYSVLATAATRPATHWDSTILETVNPSATTRTWTLHVGASFTDVPTSSPFYRFVETILHKNVTGGCSAAAYCPASSTTREQMAVFVLVSREAPGYVPPACGIPMFSDVPASSPFCRWIQELARRGVVGGCGAGIYCPSAPATREQMAVFVLRTLDPALNPPACLTPVFGDVPASSPFCRWIEELVRRGVVTGCGGNNYCPTASVTREQMSVFLAVTFGLVLYGL